MRSFGLGLAFIVSVIRVGSAAKLPPLVGDGVQDDTAAIQARLDSGAACVYLPPPEKCYKISKTLRIGSDTELRMDRFSIIRLAPGSDCPMIENKGYVGGDDRRIALTGGIWDMANVDQSPNPQQYRHCKPPREGGLPPKHENDFFFGMAMRFSHVEGMTVKGVTVRNPTSYGMAFCHTSYFLIDDITFDYKTCNPIFLNMDGVHLDGWCNHGRISNLRGTCFDDLVALNANDGQCAQEEGDVTDIDIDGVYADYCHSAVRLLSTGANLTRVTIRNVHGNFYTYAVGLTHFFGERKTRGVFDDIVISDVFMGKVFSPENIGAHSRTNFPPIWVEGAVDVGSLTISNFNRDERNIPVSTIRVDAPATIERLTVRDCKVINRLKAPLSFFDIRGKVRELVSENNTFVGPQVGKVDWVDPLIGTVSKRADAANAAGMQPFVGVPFGMWQWTAMTQLSELGKVSYDDSCKCFLGFIGTRQPAPWMGEYGQLSLMPQVGEVDCGYQTRGVAFDKERCIFTPHYSKIVMKNGIVGEVTGSSRTAMMRFTFPKGERGKLVIDASREFIAQFSDTNAASGLIDLGSRTRFSAWNDDRADAKLGPPLENCRAHFRIETSRPYSQCGIYEGGESRGADGYLTMRKRPNATSVTGNVCGAWLEFDPSDEPLLVKVSQSMIDLAQADETMRREAGDGFEFDRMCATARAEWERKLSVIDIDADEDVKKIFYTGMYHALQFPREFGEYGRYYSAFDDKVHTGDSYTSYSLWDTYRAEHAFLALAAPERVDGMMTALLQMYREGGWLPKWPNPAYTGIMVGGPAEIVLAQAYACGFRGFDVNLAYEAVKHNATVPSTADEKTAWWGREPWRGAPEARGGLTTYQALGYVAADRTEESVSRTLDFGHDDLAVAVLADAVGKTDEAAAFRKRAKNYRNLWNAAEGKFWPRKADGSWLETPRVHWNHTDYTEQSPDTAIWGVPYDVSGIAELVGGRARMVAMLDEYFDRIYYNKNGGEMTHHENEPTHHIAYLYAALGEHDKCAKHVRQILTRGYSSERWGMEGNDDCGQMSAWYILSALGFYPLDPTTGEYVIGSPLVRSATVRIGAPFAPTTFRIVVKNQSRDNYRVKSVTLNGKPLANWKIRHEDIVKGGELVFEMCDK